MVTIKSIVMNNIIKQELCKNCKLCIEVCPNNIIGLNDENETSFIPERESICLECGQCMAVCTTKAITINGLSYDQDIIDLPDYSIEYKTFLNFLANRRSVRNFKDQAVSDEILQQITDSISFAPFGAEPDKMNITVVNNRRRIENALPHIENFLDNIVKWIENPVASFMIKRKNGAEKFNTIKNHLYPIAKSGNYKLKFGDRITRDAPALIIIHAKNDAEEHTNNSLIYATYIILTAHSLGLGATMNGIVPPAINRVKDVREIFKIPDKHEAIISVMIGYPKIKYKRAIKRKVRNLELIN
jgi:ferredoxin